MMDIVKALTIRIGADVGPWEKGVANVLNNLTGLAGKASEIGGKLAEGISRGGDLAEATAALSNLGAKYGQTANDILRAMNQATDGQFSLLDMTRKASDALVKGFSPEQAALIYQFANKVSDATGKGMDGVAVAIENGLTKGRMTFLREFGIMATTSDEAFKQMREGIERMGPGVFNFGDSMKELTNSVYNLGESIYMELNNMLGAAGFGGWATEASKIFNGLREESEILAMGLFDSLKAVAGPMIEVAKLTANGIADMFYVDFTNIKESAFVMGKGVSQTLFDLKGITLGMAALATMPVTKPAEWISGMLGDDQYAVSFEFMKKFSAELKSWHNIQSGIAEQAEDSAARMLKAYDPIAKQTKAITDLENVKTDAFKTGNITLGDQVLAHKASEKAAKEQAKEMENLTKKVADSYEKMGDAGEKFVKRQDDITLNTKRKFEDLATGYADAVAKLKRDLDRKLAEDDLDAAKRGDLWKDYYNDLSDLNLKYGQDQAKVRTEEKRALEDAWKQRREEEAKSKAAMVEYVNQLKNNSALIASLGGSDSAAAKFFTNSATKIGRGVELAPQDQARFESILSGLKPAGRSAAGADSRGQGGATVSQQGAAIMGGKGGAQIVINVPKSDKLGEAFRDWLTVDAISEGTMRAGI